MTESTEHTWTVISSNRPLTREARRALKDYSIVDERHPDELNRRSEVDVDERPPDDLLDKHELYLEDPTGGQDPAAVFESPGGEHVEIYEDAVFTDGAETTTITPDEAQNIAETNGWERIEQ